MKAKVKFEYSGKAYEYEREMSKFDRNYDDEDYAYFLEQTADNGGRLFEINLVKNDGGYLTGEGAYVGVYASTDDTMLLHHIGDAEVEFTEEREF